MTIPTLLPAGFYDLPPEQALAEAACTQKVLQVFAKAGFQLVQPPLLDFTDHTDADDQTSFKLMDPMTRRMLTLRSDMTLQVARIAAGLGGECRLSYSGQVVRTLPDQTHQSRQLRQIGLESFGEQDDLSVIRVAVEALNAIGIADISIDLASPALWKALDIGRNEDLAKAVMRKDIHALKQLNEPQIAALSAITGPHEQAAAQLQAMTLNTSAAAATQALLALTAQLAEQLTTVKLTIDPLDQAQHSYYTGVSYHLYDRRSGRLIGRGGHYNNPYDGKPGCGVTLYSEDLLAAEDACKTSS
jgi:ATP phosphoribosyltransferase regulatory subunit